MAPPIKAIRLIGDSDSMIDSCFYLCYHVLDKLKFYGGHIVFDQMLKPKKSIPFSLVNKQNPKGKKKK